MGGMSKPMGGMNIPMGEMNKQLCGGKINECSNKTLNLYDK